MALPDFSKIHLHSLITHYVGNQQREEKLILSEEMTDLSDETRDYLLHYFLQPFRGEEVFSFNPTQQDGTEHEVNTLISTMFAHPRKFIALSQQLAERLYKSATHPKIKAGEMNIAYLKHIEFEGKEVDAIGLFKSEIDGIFLKMKHHRSRFSIRHDKGYALDTIDKACLIFNTNSEDGYRIQVYDRMGRQGEAQFWKNDFLNLKPIQNEYHQTEQLLAITKAFVSNQLSEEFEVNKADQIDLLNRSVHYFKKHDTFDQQQFEGEVFQDRGVIAAFQNYNQNYRRENDLAIEESFSISKQAVKNQSRIFKSILKLDKNFHVYIHGDRKQIEQGVDEDGRKYYKLYYNQEA